MSRLHLSCKFLAIILQAITIWHNLNDKLMEGRTLLEVGEIYGDTGQYQRALNSYSQARTRNSACTLSA